MALRTARMSRRRLLQAIPALGVACTFASRGNAAAPVILAAPSTSSVLLARSVDSGMLDLVAPGVSLNVWRSPDELRAALLSGRADAVTLPTNVAANMFTRGMPVRFLAVLSAGHMQVLSRNAAIRGIADLRGRRLQLYFRNDMPDIALRWLLARNRLDPMRDLEIDYAGSAVEASQLLLAGRAETVLLSEPAASVALLAAEKQGIALHRAFSLQAAWATATGSAAQLPMAGIAVSEECAQSRPQFVAALRSALAGAADWVRANPGSAGQLAEQRLGFRADATTLALRSADIVVEPASTARPAIELFLNALAELSPDLIGGRLPADGFYMPLDS